MNDTEIIAYQTGDMRKHAVTKMSKEDNQELNGKEVFNESKGYSLTRKFLPHNTEALLEAQDWEANWGMEGMITSDDEKTSINLNNYDIILSIGSTSIQGWNKEGKVVIPEKGDESFLNFGAQTKNTNQDDQLRQKLKNILGEKRVLCVNAIGYSVHATKQEGLIKSTEFHGLKNIDGTLKYEPALNGRQDRKTKKFTDKTSSNVPLMLALGESINCDIVKRLLWSSGIKYDEISCL